MAHQEPPSGRHKSNDELQVLQHGPSTGACHIRSKPLQRRPRPKDRHFRSKTLPGAPGPILGPRTEVFASRGLYLGRRCTPARGTSSCSSRSPHVGPGMINGKVPDDESSFDRENKKACDFALPCGGCRLPQTPRLILGGSRHPKLLAGGLLPARPPAQLNIKYRPKAL